MSTARRCQHTPTTELTNRDHCGLTFQARYCRRSGRGKRGMYHDLVLSCPITVPFAPLLSAISKQANSGPHPIYGHISFSSVCRTHKSTTLSIGHLKAFILDSKSTSACAIHSKISVFVIQLAKHGEVKRDIQQGYVNEVMERSSMRVLNFGISGGLS